MKFVRKGAKVPRKSSPAVGILRHESDWNVRFSNQGGQLVKDVDLFSCTQPESK